LSKKSYVNMIDEAIVQGVATVQEAVEKVYPEDAVIESLLFESFNRLSPQDQLLIVQEMGTEWYVKMAAKVRRSA
jgi:hypothetical protein